MTPLEAMAKAYWNNNHLGVHGADWDDLDVKMRGGVLADFRVALIALAETDLSFAEGKSVRAMLREIAKS